MSQGPGQGQSHDDRPAPKERTFAELFPWRNLRRAFMLLVLIVGIVIIKRSMSRLLGTATQLWGPPATKFEPHPNFGVHLSPTLGPPAEPKANPSKP